MAQSYIPNPKVLGGGGEDLFNFVTQTSFEPMTILELKIWATKTGLKLKYFKYKNITDIGLGMCMCD